MKKTKPKEIGEFENIVSLIQEARSRAYSKVNEELVLLYFNIGNIVSSKVAKGNWGEGTVDELADFISTKLHGLSGFNRRGLYRMKQFYETYSDLEFISALSIQLESYFSLIQPDTNVSAMPTQIKKKKKSLKVSAVPTQINITRIQQKFISGILTLAS